MILGDGVLADIALGDWMLNPPWAGSSAVLVIDEIVGEPTYPATVLGEPKYSARIATEPEE